MDSLRQDLKHAGQRLRRSPGFTLVAILTLALGLGGTAAVLTALEALLLRPLPYAEPHRLVVLRQADSQVGERPVAPANFLDWRERARSFDGLAAYEVVGRTLLQGEYPLRLSVGVVSGNFFEILGVAPLRGRTFARPSGDLGEAAPGAAEGEGPREVVLSHALWQSRFGGDANLLGQDLALDDELVRVVGIMPPGFGYPREAELWLRARHDVPEIPIAPRVDPRPIRDARYLAVLGRLRPNVALETARAEMDRVAAGLAADYPEANAGNGARVIALFEELRGGARPALGLLLAAAGAVLLIACANVANLLLARAVARRQELAVRKALGASGVRLSLPLLTEALLLVGLGGGAGLALFAAARPLLAGLWPADLPPLEGLRMTGPVLGLSSLLALAAVVLIGLLPARVAVCTDAVAGLRSSGRAPLAGPEAHRARGALVVAEVALAVVLVSGAALLLNSVWRLERAPLGFRAEGATSARLNLPRTLSDDAPALRRFAASLEARLRALPGVTTAGLGQRLPLSGQGASAGLRVFGHEQTPNEQVDTIWRLVTPTWFSALGLPVLKGRPFDDRDATGTERVAVVNASLARRIFGDQDPIGRRVGTGLDGPPGTWVTVVGVVADTPQERVGSDVKPELYRPLAQDVRMGPSSLVAVVRGPGDPSALAAALPRAVADLRRDVAVTEVRPLTSVARDGVATPRAASRALTLFAGLALFLAALGLYGVVSCLVGERTHEMGVRLALGARPSSLVSLVLGRSLALAGIGLALGLGMALALARLLEGLLFGVGPRDPLTLALVAVVLLAATTAAAWAPARRAARLDPAAVLRAH
jgi:predicted permease